MSPMLPRAGANCGLVIATEITTRAPVRCRRWVPRIAERCCDCGGEAPHTRVLRERLDKAIGPERSWRQLS